MTMTTTKTNDSVSLLRHCSLIALMEWGGVFSLGIDYGGGNSLIATLANCVLVLLLLHNFGKKYFSRYLARSGA